MDLRKSLPLKKSVLYSLIGHFICIGLVVYVPKFPDISPRKKVVWVELPKGSSEEIEIKIKESESLPKTTIQEQKQPQEPEVEKKAEKPMVQPPPKTKPALRPVQPETIPKKFKKKSDIEKALAALNKKRPAPPEAAQIKDKGEGFKYGTGTEPLRVPPSDPEYIAYQAKLRAKIMQEWILPSAYLEGPARPKASLVVQINQQGEIVSVEWDTPSGNPSFDSSAQRAVQRASPLPIPPQRLEWEAYSEGFLVEFDPSLKMQ